jgi:hypothetical protein
LHVVSPVLLKRAGFFEPAPVAPLFLLFRRGAENDAAVKWDRFQLDVESVAVAMRPGCSDSREEAFLAFPTVTHLVRDVGRLFAAVLRGRFGFLRHSFSPFWLFFKDPDHRGLSGIRIKDAKDGSAVTGQAENWGRPSGGTDFLLYRPGGGFKSAKRTGHVAAAFLTNQGENIGYRRKPGQEAAGNSPNRTNVGVSFEGRRQGLFAAIGRRRAWQAPGLQRA